MWQLAQQLFKREWLLLTRAKGQWAEPIVFFLLVTTIVPIVHNGPLEHVPIIAASLMWFAIVLAVLLTLDKGIRLDFLDGTFEQWQLSPHPMTGLMFIKAWAHWVLWVLPMVVLSPIIMMMLQIPPAFQIGLGVSLLLGTPTISFVAMFAASLTLTLRSSGVLLGLIMLPLIMPVILLGVAPIALTMAGSPPYGIWALLLAMSLISSLFLSFASAFGIKVSMS